MKAQKRKKPSFKILRSTHLDALNDQNSLQDALSNAKRFARFFFEQFKKMKVPIYSLTCKHAKELSTKVSKLSSCRPKTAIADATGIKVQGEGEGKVKIHGKGRPRKWMHKDLENFTIPLFSKNLAKN